MSQPVNNGQKVYTLLVQYSTRTGLPTGIVKPNIPTDPNYIAPVEDLVTCPIDSSINERVVLVEEQGGFAGLFNIKLLSGESYIETNIVGSWTVPNRTYDGVIFEIPTPPQQSYKLSIYYGDNQLKELLCVNGGNMYIPGPFPDITKLRMFADGGDYSNLDYNISFY